MARILLGGCLCGSVRYSITGSPLGTGQCFCRTCQYTSGGGPLTAFVVPESALKIISGQVHTYASINQSSGKAERSFCPSCGTPLFHRKSSSPGTVAVMAGSLDEPEAVRPTTISWTSSAPRWAYISPKLKAFPKDIDR